MKYPIEIAKVKGISLKRATEFCLGYSGLQKMQSAVMFLQGLDITVNLALKIYRVYGDATEERVRKNPYSLVDDVDGIGFQTADRIAGELGIARDSDYRICAAVTCILKDASVKGGHNFLPENELVSAVIGLLRSDSDETERRVRDNIEDMIMLGDLVRYDTGECVAVLTKQNFATERNIARRLIRLQAEAADFRADVDYEVAQFEKEAGIELHPNQTAAVRAAVENGLQIVTGGPGTGKTTIVKCIMHVFKNLGQRVALCAPTGRAAKRLSAATGEEAKTIHRLLDLDWKDGGGRFAYNNDRKLPPRRSHSRRGQHGGRICVQRAAFSYGARQQTGAGRRQGPARFRRRGQRAERPHQVRQVSRERTYADIPSVRGQQDRRQCAPHQPRRNAGA